MLDANIVAVSLPATAQDMHAAFSDIEWVVSVYVLSFAAYCYRPVSWLIDLVAGEFCLLAWRYFRSRHTLRGRAKPSYAELVARASRCRRRSPTRRSVGLAGAYTHFLTRRLPNAPGVRIVVVFSDSYRRGPGAVKSGRMKAYSAERKEALVWGMMPPENALVSALARETPAPRRGSASEYW